MKVGQKRNFLLLHSPFCYFSLHCFLAFQICITILMKTESGFSLCLDVNIFPFSKFQSLGKLWSGKLNKDK